MARFRSTSVLLDRFIVEFSLGIPDEYKIRNNRMKSIFIDAVKDLLPKGFKSTEF